MKLRTKAVLYVSISSAAMALVLILGQLSIFNAFTRDVVDSQADEMYQALIGMGSGMGENLDNFINYVQERISKNEAQPHAGIENVLSSFVETAPQTYFLIDMDGKPMYPGPVPNWFTTARDSPAFMSSIAQAIMDKKSKFMFSPRPLKGPGINPRDEYPDLILVRILYSMNGVFLQKMSMDQTRIRIQYLQGQSNEALWKLTLFTLASIFLSFLALTFISTWFINWRFIKPIRRLQSVFDEFSGSNHERRWDQDYHDEFGELGHAFNIMADEIQTWQGKLEDMVVRRNDELEEVRRQAAFGSMMAAGIAHDLKTPLSSVNTALSWLLGSTQELRKKLEAQTMTKSDLSTFLDDVDEGGVIMNSALQKAIELSRSFKEVVADQMATEAREIVLDTYLNDIILSLRPRFKKAGVAPSVICPQGIKMFCDPGALSQVLINLVENSLIHGFSQPLDGSRRIRILIRLQEDTILMEYRDNGTGLSPEAKEKLFAEMYTTKRTEGGTGYGMVMMHQLVSHRLQGTISLMDSPPDPEWSRAEAPGVCFLITLPLQYSPQPELHSPETVQEP